MASNSSYCVEFFDSYCFDCGFGALQQLASFPGNNAKVWSEIFKLKSFKFLMAFLFPSPSWWTVYPFLVPAHLFFKNNTLQ